MPTWSKQQLEAIRTVDKNIIVSASAGAGKTTVLVNRILKRIEEDHVQVNQILAMTFTAAAALEMKKRLMKQLQLRMTEVDEETKNRLAEQLTLLPTADICTIDSFCLKILKNYSYVLEQDPERFQNIFDSNTLANFENEALTIALNKQYKLRQPAFIQLLETLSNINDQHEKIKKLIHSLAQEAKKHDDPITWLQSLTTYYQEFTCLLDLPNNIQDYFFNFYLDDIQYVKDLAYAFEEFVKTKNENSELFTTYAETLHLYLQQMIDALKERNYSKFRETCEISQSLLKCPDCKKVTGYTLKDLPDYKEYRDAIHKFLENLYLEELDSERSIVNSLSRQKDMAFVLITLTIDYLQAFQQLKIDANGIDFEDMERYAMTILRKNNGEIANILRNQYVDIMVDEYQDSNDLQESIIQAICRCNNVFRVGDVKQSIYSFRNAKPSLMRGIIQNQTEHDKVIYLSNNYRSKFHIVDFNNAIFEHLMNIPHFNDTYNEMDAVSVGTDSQKENDHTIQLDILCKKPINLEQDLYGQNDLKAEYIAHKILEMKESSDFKQWKDYVVLTRTHSPKNELRRAFNKYNIPYHISSTKGYFADEAVTAILNWLYYLDNPANEIALLAILTSSYYKVTDEQLADYKLAKKSLSYFEYLTDIQHPFIQDYSYIKSQLPKWNVLELLNELFCLKKFYTHLTTELQKDNLDILYEFAINGIDHQQTLSDFLHLIEISEEKDMGDAISLSEDADVVRVITVHGSKGLEFPVVFYWASDVKRRSTDRVYTDDELGFAVDDIQLPQRFRKQTIMRKIMERKQLVSSLEEELRILYVALTRPKQKLIIVDMIHDRKMIPTKLSFQTLVKNPQISILVLAALKYNQRQYVDVNYVEHMWSTQAVQYKKAKDLHILPTFTQILETHTTIRPSALEEHKRTGLALTAKSAVSRGTLLHRVMELLDFKTYSFSQLNHFDLNTYDKRKIDNFFKHPMYEVIKDMEIHKEYPFIYKENHEMVRGIIDCLCISNDSIILIDFKTDRNVTKEELIERYKQQIDAYHKIMHLAYPTHTISCYIYSFDLSDWIEL